MPSTRIVSRFTSKPTRCGRRLCSQARPAKTFALCLLLQACGGVPQTFYYTVAPLALSEMKENVNAKPSTNAVVLGVEKFSSEALYDDDRLIYRGSPYEVKYDHYRRWASAPKQLVTEEVMKSLQAARVFREVTGFPGSAKVDYVLTGRVLAFEEWDRGEQWFGRVAFAAQLYDLAARRILWSEIFEAETRAEKRVPTAVVAAIGKSLEKCLADLQQALPEAVPR